jgi:hypothetical protein
MTLPEGVVRHETESLLREYAEGLARRGVDLEHAEIDWQKIGDEAKPHAERRVKARLLLDAVADAEQIAVTAEEFEQALARAGPPAGRRHRRPAPAPRRGRRAHRLPRPDAAREGGPISSRRRRAAPPAARGDDRPTAHDASRLDWRDSRC